MKTFLHSFLIYPLLFIFSYILKGQKKLYDNYFCKDIDDLKNLSLLEISMNNNYLNNIKYFFDKTSALYDKTVISFEINTDIKPEKKHMNIFDFSKKIDMYYSVSMLSSRVANDNLIMKVNYNKKTFDDDALDVFLRYCILSYSSRKIDRLVINTSDDDKVLKLISYMKEMLNGSTIENFSISGDLYVLTCERKKNKFDIIWSSSNREIELTQFNKVYDKFGVELKENIKISQSPIYAFHE